MDQDVLSESKTGVTHEKLAKQHHVLKILICLAIIAITVSSLVTVWLLLKLYMLRENGTGKLLFQDSSKTVSAIAINNASKSKDCGCNDKHVNTEMSMYSSDSGLSFTGTGAFDGLTGSFKSDGNPADSLIGKPFELSRGDGSIVCSGVIKGMTAGVFELVNTTGTLCNYPAGTAYLRIIT